MPSPQEVAAQDYGDPIEKDAAEDQVKNLMATHLKDPTSAIYDCQLSGQGYIGSGMAWGGSTAYGWTMTCDINGKNSFGAYAGAQRYIFVFRSGSMIRAALMQGMAMQIIYGAG